MVVRFGKTEIKVQEVGLLLPREKEERPTSP
jgi:hypothetical protein